MLSTKNCTLEIGNPSLSDAVARSCVGDPPVRVAPGVGLEIATVGGEAMTIDVGAGVMVAVVLVVEAVTLFRSS
jgi:hypothetical protein